MNGDTAGRARRLDVSRQCSASEFSGHLRRVGRVLPTSDSQSHVGTPNWSSARHVCGAEPGGSEMSEGPPTWSDQVAAPQWRLGTKLIARVVDLPPATFTRGDPHAWVHWFRMSGRNRCPTAEFLCPHAPSIEVGTTVVAPRGVSDATEGSSRSSPRKDILN